MPRKKAPKKKAPKKSSMAQDLLDKVSEAEEEQAVSRAERRIVLAELLMPQEASTEQVEDLAFVLMDLPNKQTEMQILRLTRRSAASSKKARKKKSKSV